MSARVTRGRALERAGRLGWLSSWLLLAACAIEVPVVSLQPDTDTRTASGSARRAGESDGLPLRRSPTRRVALLAVLPFADRRPEIQRDGDRTRLWPLVIYNWRKGDWVTGDRAFDPTVAEAVTAGAAEALSEGRFGRARVAISAPPQPDDRAELPPAEGSPTRRACGRGDVRYVARGSVLDLYGTLRQDFELLVLPTPFVGLFLFRNDRSDALGVARISVQILDCETGRVVFQRKLRSEGRYADISISEAAERALTDALERLRNETRSR